MSLTQLLEQEERIILEIDALQKEIDQEEAADSKEVPEWCVPIKADVLDFEWAKLAQTCQFDVICMDPPCNSLS